MKSRLTLIQSLIHLVSIILLIGMFIYVIFIWNQIPDELPIHYNVLGEADLWVGKTLVWLIPIFAFIMYLYIGSGVISLETIQVPIINDNQNKDTIVKSMNTLLELYKVEIILILFYIVINIANVHSIPSLFLPFYMLFIIAILGYFRYKLYNLGVK